MLLLAGRYDQAESAFARSAEMAPDNWMSWIGVAYARFLRGNFAGGRESAAAARKYVTRAPDKLAIDLTLAWSWLAEGNAEAALKEIDAIEAQARKTDFDYAWAAFERAEMLHEAGREVEATKQLEQARLRGSKGTLTGAEQNRLRRAGLVLQARIGAASSKPRDAEQALAALDGDLKAAPSNADLRFRSRNRLVRQWLTESLVLTGRPLARRSTAGDRELQALPGDRLRLPARPHLRPAAGRASGCCSGDAIAPSARERAGQHPSRGGSGVSLRLLAAEGPEMMLKLFPWSGSLST